MAVMEGIGTFRIKQQLAEIQHFIMHLRPVAHVGQGCKTQCLH